MKRTLTWLKLSLATALSCLAFSSAKATVVTWNLNPDGKEGPVGSSSYTFSSSGYNITASGYTLGWSSNTPLDLYFKNKGFDETGLGIVGPSDHELQGNGWYPLQVIQLDVSSILAQGFTGGKLEMGSVQSSSDDTFILFGSNTLGSVGSVISGVYDSSSDMTFIDVPNFGDYKYISIGALSGDSLPVAFQATLTPVPEVSALFPLVGFVAAVSFTQLLRRRRMAQLRADQSDFP